MTDKLKQIQPMKGRSATQIEVEAFGAICNLQDELYEACKIIQALRSLAREGSRNYQRATQFLERSDFSNAPQGGDTMK